MNPLEAENIRLRQEVSKLKDTVIELQGTIIKLLEAREQMPPYNRSPLNNWVILVDNPKKTEEK